MLKFTLMLIIFAVVDQTNSIKSIDARYKRSLDLGFFIRSLLQNSADLSNAKIQAKVPAQPTTTSTTTTTTTPSTTTTTTTEAPTTTRRPFFYKAFIKPIPFVGRLGYDINAGGSYLQQQPRIFANELNNGYINFDYDVDDTQAETTAPTTAPVTTLPAPAPSPSQPPQPTTTRQRPKQQQNRPIPMQPASATPTNIAQPQRNVQIIYQYIPVPQYKTRNSPAAKNYFANAPINYDYYDQFSNNNNNGGQLTNFENSNQIYKAQRQQQQLEIQQQQQYQPADTAPFQSHSPFTIRQRTKAGSPQILAATTQQTSAQLNENLVYQYAQTDDIYTSNEAIRNNYAEQSGVDDNADAPESDNNETIPNDPPTVDDPNTDEINAADRYDFDASINNGGPSATVAPDYAKIRFVPVSSTPKSTVDYDDDISSNLNNYKYFSNDRADLPSVTPHPQQFYNYENNVPKQEHIKPAYSSSRFHSSYVNYHSPSSSSSYSYTNGQSYQQPH